MEHKTALITGAGSGMGQAIAVDLANAGLKVALVGRDRAKLEQTVARFEPDRGQTLIEPCDVADRRGRRGDGQARATRVWSD